MSDAFILRAGGGGGISERNAIIHVIAAVGSTISFSYHGVVLKVLGPEKGRINDLNPSLADWYYSINPSKYGEWIVSATTEITLTESETISSTLIVNFNKQYDVELYRLYIFHRYDGVINGFILYETTSGASSIINDPTSEQNGTLRWGNSVGVGNQLYFKPPLDFTYKHAFSRLSFEYICTGQFSSGYKTRFGVGPDVPSGNYGFGTVDKVTPDIYTEEKRTYNLDISDVTGTIEYVKFYAYAVLGYIYNIYLTIGEVQ